MTNKGSQWSKWDLHIHTPKTKLSDHYLVGEGEDVWEKYCKTIEESDVSVFGITDYFSVENYFIFLSKHKQYYPNSTKVFFPNIELRLEVSVNKSAEEVNIHVIFSNSPSVTQAKIEEFLLKLNTNIKVNEAVIACKNLSTKDDFEKAGISHSNIRKVLREVFGKEECYLLIAAANNAGLRADTSSPRKLNLTDEIDKICDAFFGGEQNVKYYLDVERYETEEKAKQKPVLSGCDAHSFDDCRDFIGKKVIKRNDKSGKDEVIKNITWIKAELTFEGLKQILYEPVHRIHIGEQKPREPLRKIESIKLNFPTNTIIKKTGSADHQDFCLKHLKNEIQFSPYFTCLIGGRGTGKSTIINLLAETLGVRTEFFNRQNNTINIDGRIYDFENGNPDIIKVTGTEEIEFISQGKVEKLAEGNELTNLVFNERIKELESGFDALEKEFDENYQVLDNLIKLIFELQSQNDTLKGFEKEKLNSQKIVESEKDPRYKEISDEINKLNSALSLIESSKIQYSNLLNSIKDLINQTITNGDTNEYENRIGEILTILKSLEEVNETDGEITIKAKEFEEANKKSTELIEKLTAENNKLKAFFTEKGTSEESIKDSQKAAENISRLSQAIETTSQRIENINIKIKEAANSSQKLKDNYTKTERLISQSLLSINNRLKTTNENVKEIMFSFYFDKDAFKNSLFEEFYKTFSDYHIANTQIDKVAEVLFLIEPTEQMLQFNHEEFKAQIDSLLTAKSYNRNTNYVTILLNIISLASNYQIYRTLVQKHLYNISKYIKIKGYYGDRELNACSFGQRCTAVIVTLLMTGVKPLVVDEPEAHLDNRLIADYLVDLIKTKKLDRQIIFATHNSNFVINGDSELIHILEILDSTIYTNITSTTIENLTHRLKLLKLEGGKEAFISRENKYGIKN
jgi:exonuclease SbcC